MVGLLIYDQPTYHFKTHFEIVLTFLKFYSFNLICELYERALRPHILLICVDWYLKISTYSFDVSTYCLEIPIQALEILTFNMSIFRHKKSKLRLNNSKF